MRILSVSLAMILADLKQPETIRIEMNANPPVPAIGITNLNKKYPDGTWANRDINLEVAAGEILAILGPNGAGKTTLVRQITTEVLPTSGEITIHGHDVKSEPETVKYLIGVVPQEGSLYWDLSAWQHFRLFGRLRGLSRREARVRAEELVSELHLEEHKDKPVQHLSGGLQRRVFVGIATLAHPSVLVLDEPTTGLDPQSRRNLWSTIHQYKNRGTTVLLTTHYMEEAEMLSDRVGVIHEGRLIALDTVKNLLSTQNLTVKATYRAEGASEPTTIFGSDDRELVDRLRAKNVREYSIRQANLEDVYLAITGTNERFE